MVLIQKWGIVKIWVAHFWFSRPKWVKMGKIAVFMLHHVTLWISGPAIGLKTASKKLWGHSLLKAGNIFGLTAYMPLIMKWGVAKIWELILGHFWINLSKNHDFAKNEEKNSGLVHAYSVKEFQPIYDYCVYATDYEMGRSLNLRPDSGSFLFWVSLSKNHYYLKKKREREKAGAYCMYSLLKAGNLLRLTLYMPLIIKWGVAKTRFWVIFESICPKIMIFAKNEEKQWPTVCLHC